MTLWEIDIYPVDGQPDRMAQSVASDAVDLGLDESISISAAYGYLVEGQISADHVQRLCQSLLSDDVVERTVAAQVGDDLLNHPPSGQPQVVHVMPKPGVTDPVAESARRAMNDFDIKADAVCTLHKYWIENASPQQIELLCSKILSNDSIEQVVVGPLDLEQLHLGSPYQFELRTVSIRDANDEQLASISTEWQLSLTLVEMRTIQQHFVELGRDPTDVELETLAQTWSEHCSHKTLAGRIAYHDENGERQFNNMLKETIFAATQTIRKGLGDDDWCVSVFEDNAGVVRFDDEHNVAFKVETHNRPSALEPYGGANTGIGGVIRDTLGTGMGAKPICSTDVFCFAPPDTPAHELPPGVLHPRRLMKGVVSGVRDYGNRMGIPTVNGAICFDPRYVGNPLVYCGNVGILPRDKSFKEPKPGDMVVSIGGRTGRDGIHGATFSSAELTSDSDVTSGGAVQIGNAITEKMLLDVLIAARDRGLYNAVTDCGAGGFSSAVGEMGEKIGAEVWLDKAPLKYDGLSYTEIWISEAQERMVFAVPEENWDAFRELCESESVEATVIGRFEPTGRLQLKYHDTQVADLSMEFLHDGRPPIVRQAVYKPTQSAEFKVSPDEPASLTNTLLKILGSPNVCSKEWVIRQYDHEVQGGSVIKPLVGINNDGPSDAAVVRPKLNSRRGLVISCGMNPHFGELDPFHMAASAIDEAIRNCVAVGADPDRIAILDNFCWGYTDRPETLGTLVRAALACQEMAVEFKTPFISGKDSLNNEFSYEDAGGERHTISIPPSLLISAMGQVDDVGKCVTMDLKSTGNLLYQVGATHIELGGSHFCLVENGSGGHVPQVDARTARRTFKSVHAAIQSGFIRACHDLSEGGLAVAIAEMAFAGGFGVDVDLKGVPCPLRSDGTDWNITKLFAESNSRFVCEVTPECAEEFEKILMDAHVPHGRIGTVTECDKVVIRSETGELINVDLATLKQAWQSPLQWK